MIGLMQRVREARVSVAGEVTGEIGQGVLLLVCAEPGDGPGEIDWLLGKVLRMRIFADEEGRMSRSLQDIGGGLLVVSQFTLAADVARGNRPGFSAAAPPAEARASYDAFVAAAHAAHTTVATGRFAADMQVSLINDGPVTIPLRTPRRAQTSD